MRRLDRWFVVCVILAIAGCAFLYSRFPRDERVQRTRSEPKGNRLLVSMAFYEGPWFIRWSLNLTLSQLSEETKVVIHINNDLSLPNSEGIDADWDWIKDQPRVLVNPERFPVKAWTGLVARAHLSNVAYALDHDPSFSHVMMLASNCLMLRRGVEQEVFRCEATDRIRTESEEDKNEIDWQPLSNYGKLGDKLIRQLDPGLLRLISTGTAEGDLPADLDRHEFGIALHEGYFMPAQVFRGLISVVTNKRMLHAIEDTKAHLEEVLFVNWVARTFRKPSKQGTVAKCHNPILFVWGTINTREVYEKSLTLASGQPKWAYGVKFHDVRLREPDASGRAMRESVSRALSAAERAAAESRQKHIEV